MCLPFRLGEGLEVEGVATDAGASAVSDFLGVLVSPPPTTSAFDHM